MKIISLITTFLLTGCVSYSPGTVDRLSPQGEQFVRYYGINAGSLSSIRSPSLALDQRLSPYAHPNGRLQVTPKGGECETIMTLLTLGIFPGGCFNYVTVSEQGSAETINYQQSMVGWLMLPMVVIPGYSWDSDVASRRQFNDGIITAINKLATKR